MHRSKYHKTSGTKTAIVRTCKAQRNTFTRDWVILILPLIHLCISLSKRFKHSFYWIQWNNNLFSRDVTPCRWLIPDVSKKIVPSYSGSGSSKRRFSLHCLTIQLSAPLTQWHSLNTSNLEQLRCRNPKSSSDMKPRASGTNSCSIVIKIKVSRKSRRKYKTWRSTHLESMYTQLFCITQQNIGKFVDGKGKIHPWTGHEEPEGE